jgi:hypothetical protein
MIIKLPLSIYRRQAYSIQTDSMLPLRRWFIVRIGMRRLTPAIREFAVTFGIHYL